MVNVEGCQRKHCHEERQVKLVACGVSQTAPRYLRSLALRGFRCCWKPVTCQVSQGARRGVRVANQPMRHARPQYKSCVHVDGACQDHGAGIDLWNPSPWTYIADQMERGRAPDFSDPPLWRPIMHCVSNGVAVGPEAVYKTTFDLTTDKACRDTINGHT